MSSLDQIDWQRAVPLFMSEIEAMGGAERSILALARWLYRHGRPSYLLTFADRIELERQAEFPLPKVDLHVPTGTRAKLSALWGHFRGRPPGAPAPITSGYQPALYASLGAIGRFHCLLHDTPSLFSPVEERSIKQRLRLAVSNLLIGQGMRRSGGVMIVTSEFLQAECRRDFHVHAQIVRMGGLGDGSGFRRRAVEGRLRMLSVCRIEPNKRIDWMLDSLAELERDPLPLSARTNWSLTLIGKGSLLQAMRMRVQELGLEDRVHLPGFVPDAELEELYAQAHLFLMPAVQGYGIPAIEALQHGIPVLLHRESGVSDILLDTPWATVLYGGKQEMVVALRSMIDWILAGGPVHAPPPPPLPTEHDWAERVATICGYV